MIRMKQNEEGIQPFNVDFGNPDFVVLAEAYGADGHRPIHLMIMTAQAANGL